MNRFRIAAVGLALTAIALSGCKKNAPPPPAQPTAPVVAAPAPAPAPAPLPETPLEKAKRLLSPQTAQDVTDCVHAAFEALATAKTQARDEGWFERGEESVQVAGKALDQALSPPISLDDDAKTKLAAEVETVVTQAMVSGTPATRVWLANRSCTVLARNPDNVAKVAESMRTLTSVRVIREVSRCVFVMAPNEIATRTGKPWDPNETAELQLRLLQTAESPVARLALLESFMNPKLKGNLKVADAVAGEWDNPAAKTQDRYTIISVLQTVCGMKQLKAIGAKLAGAKDAESLGLLGSSRTAMPQCK
jgi:hypothetical protein